MAVTALPAPRVDERVMVRFRGEGSGTAELSWGQQEIWSAMQRQRSSLPIGAVIPLPAGTTVDDVADQLRFQLGRCPTLRTRLRFDPDGPMQVVADSGEVPLEIVEADPATDPAEVADSIWERYAATAFDYASDWPIRTAVIRHRGALTHQATVMCHLVTDAAGATAMLDELAARDPATGAAVGQPATATPPLDQVQWQRSRAGQRVTAAALRRWEELLRAVPPRRFGGSGDPRQPRYWEGTLHSVAMRMALEGIARRTNVDTSPVLLTVFAIALARLTGVNPSVIQVVVSNRFRPGLARSVSPVNQTGLFVLDVAGRSVDEAVQDARRRALAAYKYAYYDPRRMDDLIARIGRERGEELDLACYFNDRRSARRIEGDAPAPRRLRAALRESTFQWVNRQDDPFERLFLHADDLADRIALTVCADTHHLSPAEVEGCLRDMEEVAVAAALDPDTRP